MTEINGYDLCGLKELVAAGKVSPPEIVQATINHIEAVEPAINGFVQTGFDAALAAAERSVPGPTGGKLLGLPFAVKDCLEVEGWISTFGTAGYAGHVSDHSATVVRRLSAEGAILLGLTSTPELGTSIETDSLLYGRTNNPIDPAFTCGGAALVKAKGLAFVIGSDFGGGSRYTAQCCGVFAHRPSLGRVSSAGYLLGCSGMKGQMCRVAPLARSVRDLELVFDVISGADPDDPKTDGVTKGQDVPKSDGFRIGFVTGSPIAPTNPDVQAAIAAFGETLEPAHRVETPDLADLFADGGEIAFGLFCADGGRLLRHLLNNVAGTKEISRSMSFWLDCVSRLGETPAGDFIVLLSRWEALRLERIAIIRNRGAVSNDRVNPLYMI